MQRVQSSCECFTVHGSVGGSFVAAVHHITEVLHCYRGAHWMFGFTSRVCTLCSQLHCGCLWERRTTATCHWRRVDDDTVHRRWCGDREIPAHWTPDGTVMITAALIHGPPFVFRCELTQLWAIPYRIQVTNVWTFNCTKGTKKETLYGIEQRMIPWAWWASSTVDMTIHMHLDHHCRRNILQPDEIGTWASVTGKSCMFQSSTKPLYMFTHIVHWRLGHCVQTLCDRSISR